MLLDAQGLAKHYRVRRGWFEHDLVKAVDGVDLALEAGGALGLVGESGSGKSTVARLVLRLIQPTRGQIRFDGRDIGQADERALRPLRRDMQIIFQNPHSALDPRITVAASIAEPLVVQLGLGGGALRARVEALMAEVSLPGDFAHRYPHELSGGQKQRVCIARALALKPRLVVLDEPTSALDVSVQAQILAMLADLRQRHGLAYLFISHNLAVVRQVCDRVAVMYLGRIVEEGPVAEVFGSPRHPYTRALLAAVLDPRADGPPLRPQVSGEAPNPARPPSGCRFHPRCPDRAEPCSRMEPQLLSCGDRRVACHLAQPSSV